MKASNDNVIFIFDKDFWKTVKRNTLIRQKLHRGQVETEEYASIRQYHSLIPATLDCSSRESFCLGRIIMI